MNESSTHVDVAAQLRAYVGDEAQVKRGVLTLRRPMESGLIMDFDGFGKLLHHAFYNELRVDPSEHAVIITDAVSICGSSHVRCSTCVPGHHSITGCCQLLSEPSTTHWQAQAPVSKHYPACRL